MMKLYEAPIWCELCSGSGEITRLEDPRDMFGREITNPCITCRGSGLDDEYDCSSCGRTFSVVKNPPYESGTTYCCKQCARAEAVMDQMNQLRMSITGTLSKN